MKDNFVRLKNKTLNDDKSIFYLLSVIFGLIFSFASMFGDDVNGMRVEGGTIADYWNKSVEMYSTWASRLFVNFVVFLFSDNSNTFIWGIYMGASLYVLMYSLSKLFVNKNQRDCNIVIACFVMLFPFQYMNSAGWIATMTTYLSPTAFGFLSLIPIKKVYLGQKFRIWECILYPIALVYGANNEQMMVVILGSYIVAAIYLFIVKKNHLFICIQLLLAIGSCLITLLCPGNYVRKNEEITNWYKNWGMFNSIDKIDLGYSTTMQWLFFGSHIFVIATCILFTFIIWKKYKKVELVSIAAIPTMLIVFLGPLRSITLAIYPNISDLTDSIEWNGLVTVANRGDLKAFGRYFIWSAMIILLCIVIFLLHDNIRSLIISIVMIGTGTASRLVMGFSPTIYASGARTFTNMAFCIIAVSCFVYANAVESGCIERKEIAIISTVSKAFILFSMINILFLVA